MYVCIYVCMHACMHMNGANKDFSFSELDNKANQYNIIS